MSGEVGRGTGKNGVVKVSVQEKTRELARELKESEDYIRYQELKEKISQDKEVLEMLKEFRGKQLAVQSTQLSGEEVSQKQREELQQLYELAIFHEDLKALLEVESRLIKTLNQVQKTIGEAIDLNFGYPTKNE